MFREVQRGPLRCRPGLITLYPRRGEITQVDDVDDGLRVLAAVRDAFGLLENRYEPTDCPALNEAEFHGRRQTLIDILPSESEADQ